MQRMVHVLCLRSALIHFISLNVQYRELCRLYLGVLWTSSMYDVHSLYQWSSFFLRKKETKKEIMFISKFSFYSLHSKL